MQSPTICASVHHLNAALADAATSELRWLPSRAFIQLLNPGRCVVVVSARAALVYACRCASSEDDDPMSAGSDLTTRTTEIGWSHSTES